jgi:hypothetical protein
MPFHPNRGQPALVSSSLIVLMLSSVPYALSAISVRRHHCPDQTLLWERPLHPIAMVRTPSTGFFSPSLPLKMYALSNGFRVVSAGGLDNQRGILNAIMLLPVIHFPELLHGSMCTEHSHHGDHSD